MSKSFLIDVEKMIGKDKMEDYLKEINQDPFEEMKNQVKSMFSYLQDDDIVEILKKHNNNMDEAFEDFVNRNSEIEENKKRERQLEEERRKKEIHNKYIEQFVRNFQMFDKKEIEEAFKKNNNDPQLTSKQLYQMMKEREQQNEEAKKLKREIEIQNMCVGFLEKFGGLSKQEIIEVINQHDMDVEKISFELGKIQKQKIFDDLFIQYHNSFSSEEIRKTLDECNWSKIEAIKTFQNKIREKELELQKQRELEYQKQIELKQQKEKELQLQLEIQKKREEELQKQKEYEIEREKELQKQKELEIQRQKEVELKKQQEIDRLCEIQKQKELDFQVQLEIQRQKELEFKKKIEEQEEKQRELERQLEIQKQKELDFQRELLEKQKELEKKKEEQKVEIPKLEYSQEQMQNLLEESKSKMIDVQKIIQEEEERKEEETKKNIENMILEYSNPEETPIKENVPQNECKIVIVEQDNKLVATVDFKSQTSYSWIGFYNKEDKDPNYKSYNYLCKLTEGKFVVDKPLLNGTYHFRVFLSGYISVGNSEDVVVSRKDFVTMARDEKNDKVTNVTWDMGSVDPVAVGAYVTIHKKEEERANYYRRWNWIKTFSGTHSFKTPIHTGEYEARVYFNGKVQFKSDIMKIEGI